MPVLAPFLVFPILIRRKKKTKKRKPKIRKPKIRKSKDKKNKEKENKEVKEKELAKLNETAASLKLEYNDISNKIDDLTNASKKIGTDLNNLVSSEKKSSNVYETKTKLQSIRDENKKLSNDIGVLEDKIKSKTDMNDENKKGMLKTLDTIKEGIEKRIKNMDELEGQLNSKDTTVKANLDQFKEFTEQDIAKIQDLNKDIHDTFMVDEKRPASFFNWLLSDDINNVSFPEIKDIQKLTQDK